MRVRRGKCALAALAFVCLSDLLLLLLLCFALLCFAIGIFAFSSCFTFLHGRLRPLVLACKQMRLRLCCSDPAQLLQTVYWLCILLARYLNR